MTHHERLPVMSLTLSVKAKLMNWDSNSHCFITMDHNCSDRTDYNMAEPSEWYECIDRSCTFLSFLFTSQLPQSKYHHGTAARHDYHDKLDFLRLFFPPVIIISAEIGLTEWFEIWFSQPQGTNNLLGQHILAAWINFRGLCGKYHPCSIFCLEF